MGYIINLTCPICGENGPFHLGYGRKNFQSDSPNILGFCRKCNSFHVMQPGDSCGCGGSLSVVYDASMREAGIKTIPCPICKSDLQLTSAGLWD